MRPCCANGRGCGAGWTAVARMCARNGGWAGMAAEWAASGNDPSFLASGTRLEQLSAWAGAPRMSSTGWSTHFSMPRLNRPGRSTREREAQRRRELETAQQLAAEQQQRAEDQTRAAASLRRRAFWLTGALVMAVILASAGGLLWQAGQRECRRARQNAAAANANAQQAETERRTANSRELAAAAVSHLAADPERSILLALQAINVTTAAHRPALVEAEDALHRAVESSHLRRPCVDIERGSGA